MASSLPLSVGWTVAAGSAFFGCLKLWGIGDKFMYLNVHCGCVVHAQQKKACPGRHLSVCMCSFCICVCVLLSSRILAVTLQSSDSRGEAALLVSAAVSSKEIWRRRFLLSTTKPVII